MFFQEVAGDAVYNFQNLGGLVSGYFFLGNALLPACVRSRQFLAIGLSLSLQFLGPGRGSIGPEGLDGHDFPGRIVGVPKKPALGWSKVHDKAYSSITAMEVIVIQSDSAEGPVLLG